MALTEVISESNNFFLDTLQDLATLYETGKYNTMKYNDLKNYKKKIKIKHDHFKERINNFITKLLILGELQQQL